MGHKATPHADGTGRRHAVYEATLRSVGNPDFGQYSPVSPRRKVRAGSLRDVLVAAAEYIGEWDLGGGNWTQPTVYEVRATGAGRSATSRTTCASGRGGSDSPTA